MIPFKKHIVSESIVDPVQPHLSSDIFDNFRSDSPTLKLTVISEIHGGLKAISAYAKIVDYVLIGSIITRRYTKQSDLDITVLVDASDATFKKIKSILPIINGNLVQFTEHPINYFIVNNSEDYTRKLSLADGVFDVEKNRFRRRPIFKKFNIKKYLKQFNTVISTIDSATHNLVRDLFDYDSLNNATTAELKYLRLSILERLEDDAKELSNIYYKIKKARNAAFDRPMNKKEIKTYGDKNRLPENVIYKLLEKYHYLDFLHKVDSILGDDKELSAEDATQLVSIFNSL
jgi:predicted nucleotidyltransferase